MHKSRLLSPLMRIVLLLSLALSPLFAAAMEAEPVKPPLYLPDGTPLPVRERPLLRCEEVAIVLPELGIVQAGAMLKRSSLAGTWKFSGLETAEILSQREKNNAVLVLEAAPRLAPGAQGSNRNSVTAVLELGNVVFLEGILSLSKTLAMSSTSNQYTMCTIPAGYRPPRAGTAR